MQTLLSLIVLLLAFVVGLNGQMITASFEVTTARYNYGYYVGTLYYSWSGQALKLSFPNNDQYAELYIFNGNKGYPTGGSTAAQFSSQYLYKSSINCSCETTTLSLAMPYFGASSTYWKADGTTSVFKGITGTHYVTAPAYTAYDLVTDMWLTSSGNLLAFKMTDTRLFTIDQNSYKTTFAANVLAAPTNCKCGKPLDVVVSLDRTGSIDYNEWIIEKAFTKNLTRSFDYGELKTNLAIINWNSAHWVTIPLTAGVTATAVDTAVEAMGCCGSGSCCCCGTDIGGGLYSAGVMMLTSTRPTATKVVILLTDGCQNHKYIETQNPPVVACSCGGESACATNQDCLSDITYHYTLLKQKVTTVKVIIVGVGDALCTDQLLLAAGGPANAANVYSTTSWSQLTSLVTSLAATACTVDDDLCSGCCGFCSCGLCITPTLCQPPDACSVAAPDPSSGGCCAVTPKICTARNLCYTSSCDPVLGCVDTPKLCRPNQTCTYYKCDEADGICKPIKSNAPECNPTPTPVGKNYTAPPPTPTPNCYKDTDCDYGDKCLVSKCIAGNCYYNNTICPTKTACLEYTCQSTKGCVVVKNVTCNDNSKCTTDRCDPSFGCRFTPITCPPTRDFCIETSCNAVLGCINNTNTCANFTGNCTVGNCRNNSCKADNVCLPPPPPTGTSDDVPPAVIVGGSLGAAAVVAIVVCILIALFGVGGGAAYAISQAGAGGGAASTQVNPLYKGTGNAGTNPLFRA